MPSLGADMVEGTLTSWNVEVGQPVERGDIICEVETNKGDIEVEIWESGVVTELRVEPGQKVPVGEVIALLDTGAEAPEPPTPEPEPETPSDPADRTGERVLASPAARRRAKELGVDLRSLTGTGVDASITRADVEAARKPRISPVAKRIADEQGLNLHEIQGSGPGGTIRRADVEDAAPQKPAPQKPPQPDEEDPLSAMRQAIAIAMARSKREIPHYYLYETVPLYRATEWLRQHNAEQPVGDRLLMGVLFLKAVALACRDVPEMNGFFSNDRFEPRKEIHPGFAIALRQGGVIPPAVHDADQKGLSELMDHLRELTRRVRRGKLRSSEVTDATITITSLGDQGVEAVFGVIYPPQVALVGFGKVTPRFWAHDGLVGTRPAVTVTLAADHRVSDGLTGARFLATISDLLQHPEDL